MPAAPAPAPVRHHARPRARGAAPCSGASADLSRVVVEPPRDADPRRHGDQRRHGAGERCRQEAARSGRGHRRRAARRSAWSPRSMSPGPASSISRSSRMSGARSCASCWRRAPITAAATMGANEKVNVEYVSANPTGPMHVGHGRGAVFGDALANLLAFAGYDVTREYYINDAGAQVDVLARSAFLRYREALGENIGAIPEGLYPGDYLVPVGAALAAEHRRGAQRQAGSRMAAARARQGHRHDDGHDPRRSRRAQRAPRRVLFRALADRRRRRSGRRHHRVLARQRRGL